MKYISLVGLLCLCACGSNQTFDLTPSVDRIVTAWEKQKTSEIELQTKIAFAECMQRGFDVFTNPQNKTHGDAEDIAKYTFTIAPCEEISSTTFDKLRDNIKVMKEIKTKKRGTK